MEAGPVTRGAISLVVGFGISFGLSELATIDDTTQQAINAAYRECANELPNYGEYSENMPTPCKSDIVDLEDSTFSYSKTPNSATIYYLPPGNKLYADRFDSGVSTANISSPFDLGIEIGGGAVISGVLFVLLTIGENIRIGKKMNTAGGKS